MKYLLSPFSERELLAQLVYRLSVSEKKNSFKKKRKLQKIIPDLLSVQKDVFSQVFDFVSAEIFNIATVSLPAQSIRSLNSKKETDMKFGLLLCYLQTYLTSVYTVKLKNESYEVLPQNFWAVSIKSFTNEKRPFLKHFSLPKKETNSFEGGVYQFLQFKGHDKSIATNALKVYWYKIAEIRGSSLNYKICFSFSDFLVWEDLFNLFVFTLASEEQNLYRNIRKLEFLSENFIYLVFTLLAKDQKLLSIKLMSHYNLCFFPHYYDYTKLVFFLESQTSIVLFDKTKKISVCRYLPFSLWRPSKGKVRKIKGSMGKERRFFFAQKLVFWFLIREELSSFLQKLTTLFYTAKSLQSQLWQYDSTAHITIYTSRFSQHPFGFWSLLERTTRRSKGFTKSKEKIKIFQSNPAKEVKIKDQGLILYPNINQNDNFLLIEENFINFKTFFFCKIFSELKFLVYFKIFKIWKKFSLAFTKLISEKEIFLVNSQNTFLRVFLKQHYLKTVSFIENLAVFSSFYNLRFFIFNFQKEFSILNLSEKSLFEYFLNFCQKTFNKIFFTKTKSCPVNIKEIELKTYSLKSISSVVLDLKKTENIFFTTNKQFFLFFVSFFQIFHFFSWSSFIFYLGGKISFISASACFENETRILLVPRSEEGIKSQLETNFKESDLTSRRSLIKKTFEDPIRRDGEKLLGSTFTLVKIPRVKLFFKQKEKILFPYDLCQILTSYKDLNFSLSPRLIKKDHFLSKKNLRQEKPKYFSKSNRRCFRSFASSPFGQHIINQHLLSPYNKKKAKSVNLFGFLKNPDKQKEKILPNFIDGKKSYQILSKKKNDWTYFLLNTFFFTKNKSKNFLFVSKWSLKAYFFELKTIIRKNMAQTQNFLIQKLSKIISKWCSLLNTIYNKNLLRYCDFILFKILWRWCCRRHPKKSNKWIQNKYFVKLSWSQKTRHRLGKTQPLLSTCDKRSYPVFGSYEKVENRFCTLPNHCTSSFLPPQLICKKEQVCSIKWYSWLASSFF